jgi:hypothetical protein
MSLGYGITPKFRAEFSEKTADGLGCENNEFPGFLMGVLGKVVFFVWCFCGEFVVICVAKPGQLCGFAPLLKVGQDSNKYFRGLSGPSVRVSAPGW